MNKLLPLIVLLVALQDVISMPQQLHIAYGNSPSEMLVMFATEKDDGGFSYVRWSLDATGPLNQTAIVYTVDSGAGRYVVHHATLTNLTPGAVHRYQAGWKASNASDILWRSDVSFVAQIIDTDKPVRLAMFGDLGYTDVQILPQLAEESRAHAIDAIVLYGDMVYWRDVPTALPSPEAYGAFMNDVEVTSGGGAIPFMVTPGNGEVSLQGQGQGRRDYLCAVYAFSPCTEMMM